MARQRQLANTLLAPAVQKAINALTVAPEDAGAVQLAHSYARLIDDAAPLAKYHDPLRKIAAGLDPDDSAAADAFNKIRTALSEHSVASDLGPKLLATLTALGATPASRAAKGGQSGAPVTSKLDELRARRAKRAGAN